MGLKDIEIRRLKEAGFLHDIGKIVLNDNLLNKQGKLTEEERKEIHQHPVVGYRILNSFDATLDLAEPVLTHHERWDGSGYPKGLKGEEIPIMSRIIAVAEFYDKMTCRPDNKPLSKDDIIKELKMQAATRFDPTVVAIMTTLILENDL